MKFSFAQRHRIEAQILPAVVADPEYAATEIMKLETMLYQIAQAPYPLHDHCDSEVWELACNLVASLRPVFSED